ncbi:MAG: hypothetical protein ACYTAF_11685 [Planctomycetota bacterium]
MSGGAAPTGRSEPGGDLNALVLDVLREYPADGSYGYFWPKEGAWEGTTKDVVYGGRKLATGDPQRRSYCCGLMFEVYVEALVRAHGGPAPGVTADDLHELRLRMFGDSKQKPERRRLVQFALESTGLGRAVDPTDARPGDFVQFWRSNGTGHSAVFLGWTDDGGIRYWSTQESTGGIAEKTEEPAPDEIYFGRAMRMRSPSGA